MRPIPLDIFLPELDLLAEAHGFSRINAEEFLTGSKPSDSTWGVCITLGKLNDDLFQ